MRIAVVMLASIGCVYRVDTTRVTVRDPAELAVDGSGSLPVGSGELGVVDHDVVMLGKPADVLAFDGDELHMRYRVPDRRRPLDLRVDTPLANVSSVRAVGVVANHSLIPLGLLAGGLFAGVGAVLLVDDLDQHASVTTPAIALTAGLVILALEIEHRLARDTVSVVRVP